MMGHREKLKGGDEWDVVSPRARKILCYTSHAGICKAIKKKMNRRARKNARREITRIAQKHGWGY